ncbi:MAG: alpha-1,2-fucosyltransferase [Verrucomicrobiota bacterium]
MIRVVMLGRLGNNMFQYSLGRILSRKHGVPLVMDGSWFNREGWGQVKCLKRLPGPAAGKARIVRRVSLGTRALLKATGKHYWEYRGVPVLRESERDQSYDPRFLDAPNDCMLFGYFQTPIYFQGHEQMLREELSTADLGLELGCEALAARLREKGAVAVHVRRTDYAGNPQLDLCGPEYYRAAMERMRDDSSNVRFFIFSDDPVWCARHMSGRDVEVVQHDKPYCALTDMHLMGLANDHIIANSSYSWWAAWLGKKPGQRVMMPARWFGSINAPIDQKHCDGWEIITPPRPSSI